MTSRMTKILFACAIGLVFSTPCRAELRAGAAKIEINPAIGVSLDGPISKNGGVQSIHDPLHARALVLDDGKTQLALVVVDQCTTGRDVFDSAKEKIFTAIGLPTTRVLIAATHTHAAPRTIHVGRDPIDEAYHVQLAEWIAEAVLAANENLEPAAIAYASFDEGDLLACRRFLCEPGSVQANPFGEVGEQIKSVSGRSEAVIRPAGPVDPQFSVLSVRHLDGSPLCLLGNFSVHYCGGYQKGAVSADYFGAFSSAVEAALGRSGTSARHPSVVGIMSNGTSGDTGSFQRNDGQKFAPFEGMEYYGRLLAEKAVAAISDAEHHRDLTLDMIEHELVIDVRRPDAVRLRWAEEILQDPAARHAHPWTRVYAQEALHLAKFPASQTIKLQAIRIGDIGIAAAPCEVFAETGLAIKHASPIHHTFCMELANGYGGYLPSIKQHQLGGYESWPARSSFLAVDAEEKIRTELIRLLRDLARTH